MADKENLEQVSESEEKVEAQTDSVESVEDDQAGPDGPSGGTEDTHADDTPPGWRKELDRARREAANYRQQLREAQTKLEQSKPVEEFNEVVADFTKKLNDSERERVLEQYRVPEDLRALVQGETVEEWEASAKLISERLTPESGQKESIPTATPPSGARGSGVRSNDKLSPVEAASRTFNRY